GLLPVGLGRRDALVAWPLHQQFIGELQSLQAKLHRLVGTFRRIVFAGGHGLGVLQAGVAFPLQIKMVALGLGVLQFSLGLLDFVVAVLPQLLPAMLGGLGHAKGAIVIRLVFGRLHLGQDIAFLDAHVFFDEKLEHHAADFRAHLNLMYGDDVALGFQGDVGRR